MDTQKNTIEKEASVNVSRRFNLLKHFFVFSVVNGLLLGFDYLVTKEGDWAYIPLFAWGVVLFGHSLSVVFSDFFEGWRRRLVNSEIKKLKEKN
ncbi:MAG: 2TM domain-containing protein [Patescibacteria group bacterium]|nr:2TM domain-containing protein [Patescibacteria group bacterium]